MIFNNSEAIVIITGGSSGIGFNLLSFFLKKRFNVINIDKKNIKLLNKNYKFINCDLSKTSFIKKKLDIIKKEKKIIGLVNCAGTTISEESMKYKLKNWNLTFSINLTAPFYISQIISKIMLKNKTKGSIINIASISGKVAMPNNPAYNASKAGLLNLTKSLAVDLAKYKIRVNSISPGYTNTSLNSKSWNDKKLRSIRTKKTLLNRWASPDEYNEAVHFLLDNSRSSYMTGSNITIDGGWTSKGL
jgi:NAD(P)-dependent dehydrogenase (short-subunit alcohol dehydrogenase family)